MKQSVLIFIAITFLGCNRKSQVVSEIERAFEIVNDGLERTQSEEYQEYYEKLRSSDSTEQLLLEQIKSGEDSTSINASKDVVLYTYQIEKKIDSIIQELEETYTLDDKGNFNNKKDKTRINQIMITNKRGRQLEELISKRSRHLLALECRLQLVNSESLVKLKANLNIPDNESWDEYHFHDMPVGAAIPILKHIKNNAKMTRIELLEAINNRKR